MNKMFMFVLGLILLGSTIQADFSELQLLNTSDSDILFNGKDAARFYDNKLYLTFYERVGNELMVKLALSENSGDSFLYYQIDSMPWNSIYRDIEAPELQISDDGMIVIIYQKQEEFLSLYKARASYNDLEFNPEIIDTEVLGSHALDYVDGEFILVYNTLYDQYAETLLYCTKHETYGTVSYQRLLYFWGPDVFDGPVHSNDYIDINQIGGGNNNGWPTFYDFVSSSKYFMMSRYQTYLIPIAPIDEIFQNYDGLGYQEQIPEITNIGDSQAIYENGLHPFDSSYDIIYLKLNGNSYDAMQGDIVPIDTLDIPVYSWFPADSNQVDLAIEQGYNWFEDSDSIWTNHVTIYDTIWTPISGALINESIYVESELWIEGNVAGNLSIACADTVYITGDITYASTDVGDDPADHDNPNYVDYFGLISEKSIIIKYKHRDPFNNDVIIDDNCNDIYLYGVYQALGVGEEEHGEYAPFYDGQFTYEYKHPHGSTPDFVGKSPYTLQDTLYRYVDLHKYIFPKQEGLPAQIDGFNLHGNDPYNYTQV